MQYTQVNRDGQDHSFKLNKHKYLCYSKKQLNSLYPDGDYTIVGEARMDKKHESENSLRLGANKMPVFNVGDTNKFLFKKKGYVYVGDKQFIAIEQSRVPFLASLLAVLLVAAVAVIAVVMLTGNEEPPINPMPPVDTNIEDTAETNTPTDVPKGGGSVTINFKPSATMVLSTGEITMNFANPGGSTHDAVLELYVVNDGEDVLIATSGRIPAGKQLSAMHLDVDKALFSQGKYDAKYKVIYYDAKTGEKAMVDSQLENIVLTVLNEPKQADD